MRRALLFALVLAVSPLFACSGGGGDEKISENDAEDLAEDALLELRDLPAGGGPGTGWEETSRDDFEETDDFAGIDECEDLEELLEEDDDDEPLVETNVTYQRGTTPSDPLGLEVSAEIGVHEGTAKDEDLGEQFDEILDDSNFEECMTAFVEKIGKEAGGRGEYRSRKASVRPPENGGVLAFGFIITIENVKVEGVGELYFWNVGHVESQLSFFGSPAQMKKDVIQEILDLTEEKVSEAQEED